MAQENKAQSEIRYLNPVSVDVKKKKLATLFRIMDNFNGNH